MGDRRRSAFGITLVSGEFDECAHEKMIRYRVRADRAEENARLIAAVFESLERERPAGLRYTAFVLEDGVSFVHLVSLDGEVDSNPLQSLPAFRAFVSGVKDRCKEQPTTVTLRAIGSYRVFDG